jgi:hypothetical protein
LNPLLWPPEGCQFTTPGITRNDGVPGSSPGVGSDGSPAKTRGFRILDRQRPGEVGNNKTINGYIGRALGMRVEVHGNPMRYGAGLWRSITEPKRNSLATALLAKVSTGSTVHRYEAAALAVVIDRDHSTAPTEFAYGELLHLFDEFLRRGRCGGNPHSGVLVANRSRYQRTIEAWVEVARVERGAHGKTLGDSTR